MRTLGEPHGRHDYAPNTTASDNLILGCVLGDDADPGQECPVIPEAARHQMLRNRVSDLAQTTRRYDPA
jgi:hypothetical protein